MQPYRLSHGPDAKSRVREIGPLKPSDTKWYGVRQFWTRSYDGLYAPNYDEGVALAKEDIEAGVRVNRDALKAIAGVDRDLAWHARRDGYLDTIGKAQGALEARL